MHKSLNKKSLDFHQGFVLEAGLEPARPKRAQDFKSGVSTIPPLEHRRARDGIRTRDPDLGKVVLYQLSYSRLNRAHFRISDELSAFISILLFSFEKTKFDWATKINIFFFQKSDFLKKE